MDVKYIFESKMIENIEWFWRELIFKIVILFIKRKFFVVVEFEICRFVNKNFIYCVIEIENIYLLYN